MSSDDALPVGESIVDDLLMIFLSLVSVFLLSFEVLADHSPEQTQALEVADIAIALIFLGEFGYRLARAPERGLFLRKHWWELLASIPITSSTTQALRGLNLLRVFRLVRLLRLVRFLVRLKVLVNASREFAEEAYLLYLCTLVGVVVLSGALGFHYFEAEVNPNVHGLWDSFWWTISTVTTVGYGDIYPVTTGGRILAIFLMLGGVATVSAVTAAIAATLVERRERARARDEEKG